MKTEADVNKAVFADKYLAEEPALYRLCVDTCLTLVARGWTVGQYGEPSMEGLAALSVTFRQRSATGERVMDVLFGSEWPRAQPRRDVARIKSLVVGLRGRREPGRLTTPTKTVALPLDGGDNMHVHQYDPVLTAAVLATMTDEELVAEYTPEAVQRRFLARLASDVPDLHAE